MDTTRQLDDLRSHAKSTRELFLVPAQSLRIKLREIAERLLFSSSLFQRHKVEEILWRKGFYEDVSTAKRLRKENQWLPEERSQLLLHLKCGIGFYHHLILYLQSEFGISSGCVDFPMMFPDQDYGKSKPTPSSKQLLAARDSIHRCLVCLGDLNRYLMDIPPCGNHKIAFRYYHQALSWNPDIGMPHNQLGTLSLSTNCNLDAVYYYMRCLMCVQSFEGAEGNLKRSFERNAQKVPQERTVGPGSTFWRCHCLAPGSAQLSESQDHVQQFITHFLLLADLWYFDKKPVSNLSDLCHQTLLDFRICLGFTESINSNSENHYLSSSLSRPQENFPSYLSKDMVLKIVVVTLICLYKLRSKGSVQVSSLVAFLLAIFCLLIQQVQENFQDSVLNLSLPIVKDHDGVELSDKKSDIKENDSAKEEQKSSEDSKENGHLNGDGLSIISNGISNDVKKRPKKLKRIVRRRHRQSNTSDSDESNDEECNLSASSDLSEDEEVVLDLSSDEDGELNGRINGGISSGDNDADVVILEEVTDVNDISQSAQVRNGHGSPSTMLTNLALKPANPIDVLEQVAEESLLPAIKVCVDWLLGDKTVVEACGRESFDLIKKFVELVNVINIDLKDIEEDLSAQSYLKHYSMIEGKCKVPLPEDAQLQKLTFLDKAHENLDWELIRQKCLSSKEEALLRIQRLVQFCNFLETIPETGVEYHSGTRKFLAKKKVNIDTPTKAPVSPSVDHQRREEVMHNMGQLWLRAEVQNLETSVKRGSRGATFSPYLVLDVDALTKYYQMVGQLMASRKFIMVVPSIVLTALDQLKRDSALARNAIRWLEFQFQKGSRFLRAQKSQEALHLPLVSYPKQKSREAWTYFQVLECCHYLNNQSSACRNKDSDANFVTLLTGHTWDDSTTFSPVGVAKAVGISLEHIESFFAKWKTSSKSHG